MKAKEIIRDMLNQVVENKHVYMSMMINTDGSINVAVYPYSDEQNESQEGEMPVGPGA